MTRRWPRALLAGAVTVAALASCSDISDIGNGVVSLEVQVPIPAEVAVGGTLQLTARALDRNGDEVEDAPIAWHSLDPDKVTVNETTGLVTGVATPSGRVQATTGSLASDFTTITVTSP